MVEPGGKHVIADYWGILPHRLTSVSDIETVLKESAVASGATVLSSNFHHFGEGYGLTGVIILAESHISIHTWPEEGYCALDIFMCGSCNPEVALKIIDLYLQSAHSNVKILNRRKG